MLLNQFLNRPNYGSAGLLANPTRAGRIPGVTDELWQRLLRRESGARQFAADGSPVTSPKGATGIAQVMPATAKEVAAQLGEPYSDERLKTDAAFNERIGKTYLNNMLDRFGGNQTLALAGYNAGPGNVDKWLKSIGDPRSGQISEASWAQAIPYQETRDYVSGLLPDLGQSPGAMGGRAQAKGPVDPSAGLPPPAAPVSAPPALAAALPDGARAQPADQPNGEAEAASATPRGILDILGVNQPAPTDVSRETADNGLLGLGINRGATGDVLAALSQALIGAGSGDFAGGAALGLKAAQQRRTDRRTEARELAADQRQSLQDQLANLKLGLDYQTLQDEQTTKAEEKTNLEAALASLSPEERAIARLDPKGFASSKAKGLFETPAQTDKLKNLAALGIDPNSAEGRAYILGGGDDGLGSSGLTPAKALAYLTGQGADRNSPVYKASVALLSKPSIAGYDANGQPIVVPGMDLTWLDQGQPAPGTPPVPATPSPAPVAALPRGGAPMGAGQPMPSRAPAAPAGGPAPASGSPADLLRQVTKSAEVKATESQAASRANLLKSGLDNFSRAMESPNASPVRREIANLADELPFGGLVSGKIQSDDDQRLAIARNQSLEAMASAVTGAGVTQDQFTRFTSMLPTGYESPQIRREKMLSAYQFLRTQLDAAGSLGRAMIPDIDASIASMQTGGGEAAGGQAPTTASQSGVVDWRTIQRNKKP